MFQKSILYFFLLFFVLNSCGEKKQRHQNEKEKEDVFEHKIQKSDTLNDDVVVLSDTLRKTEEDIKVNNDTGFVKENTSGMNNLNYERKFYREDSTSCPLKVNQTQETCSVDTFRTKNAYLAHNSSVLFNGYTDQDLNNTDTLLLMSENYKLVDDGLYLSGSIPEKKILGRIYNRGVVNHLFIRKNTWMTGLTISHGQYSSDDVQFLSFLKDFDCNAKILAVNPFVGYFISDNVALGLKFGYQNIYAGLKNVNLDIDENLSLSIKNMSFEEVLYKTTFFHRSYVGIDKGKRFGLFNETALSFNMGNSRYIRGNESVKDTYTKIMEMNISLNPGASVFLMENICAELSFGVMGFKYRQEKQTTNGISSGWRKSSGANFKINLLNVSIGVVAFM